MDAELQVNLGTVRAGYTEMQLKLIVKSNGEGHVMLYGNDTSDRRSKGFMVFFDRSAWRELKEAIIAGDEAIKRLNEKGQISTLKLPWG